MKTLPSPPAEGPGFTAETFAFNSKTWPLVANMASAVLPEVSRHVVDRLLAVAPHPVLKGTDMSGVSALVEHAGMLAANIAFTVGRHFVAFGEINMQQIIAAELEQNTRQSRKRGTDAGAGVREALNGSGDDDAQSNPGSVIANP